MNESWQTLSEEIPDSNPWWSHVLRRFRTPNGSEGEYHFVRNDGAVLIVARDDDGRFVMINEYRYVQDRMSLSVAAGGIEPGESPEESALRELVEETGFEAGTIVKIGEIAAAPAFADENMHIFFATDLRKVGEHDGEVSDVVSMSAHEIDDAVRDGRIWDSHAIAAWYLVRLHLGL